MGQGRRALTGDAEPYSQQANLTVVPSPWQSAQVGEADLVICVHVLYSVKEPVRFIEKLEAAATERVFIVMRDSPHTHPAEHLAASGKVQPPQLRECFMLLRQIGIAPDVAMFTHQPAITLQISMRQLRNAASAYGRASTSGRGAPGWRRTCSLNRMASWSTTAAS